MVIVDSDGEYLNNSPTRHQMACRQVDNIPKYPRRSSAQFSITDVVDCSTDHFVNDLNEDWDAPANFENEQSEEDECIDNFRAERFDDFQAISDQSKICFVPNSTNQTESHAKAENPSLLSDDSVKGNENQLLGCDYETVFTNSKAGMDGVDKDYVKKVVFEMSRSSDFSATSSAKTPSTARPTSSCPPGSQRSPRRSFRGPRPRRTATWSGRRRAAT